MSVELKVPVLPESVADATVTTWHKQPGDAITRDENLVDLETDKVVLEVPSPVTGTLESISVESGATVAAGDLLGMVAEGAPTNDSAAQSDQTEATEPAGERAGAQAGESTEPDSPTVAETVDDDVVASPAARRLMNENGIDPADVKGTGRNGGIIKEDVMAFMDEPKTPAGTETAVAEERVPMSRLRRRIAERMLEAQHQQALLTSFNEVDMAPVMALRRRYKEAFQERHDVKLGIMSFFVKAAAEALIQFPIVNASVEDDDIVYHAQQNIGIAVSTQRGLVVPVLRDVANLSFADIEQQIRDFAAQGRDGKLALEDLQGGTFSITNGGVFGSLMSTPIVNPPQSAILGMHAIKERPAVVDGEVVARPMMYTALTYDHRIIDGRDAVLFLVAIKDALEDPSRMLLGI